jgi:hypothetical protein
MTCVQFTTAPKSVKRWFERASGGCPPGHQAQQDQGEPERAHHLDQRVARREGGAENHSVEQVHGPAERDAHDVREPVGTARVIEEVVGDQGTRRTDCAERDVQHARRLVEHHEADAGERVGTAERQPEHDVQLQERPVHAEHRERHDAMHWSSEAPSSPRSSFQLTAFR